METRSEPSFLTGVVRWSAAVFRLVFTALFLLTTLFFAFAIHYWLGWPDWVRTYGSIAFAILLLGAWFAPLWNRIMRRGLCLLILVLLGTAYQAKTPVEQAWVPLHQGKVSPEINGDIATIANFRDALHSAGKASTPRWTTAEFDLDKLVSSEVILQPFGTSKATEHVLLSFRFDDGRHIAVSMEARRTSWESFDALAGFFRHDQIYPVIGTERDLLWKRLARAEPFEMKLFPLKAPPDQLRIYFRRILDFASDVKRAPEFYSTLTESCMTTLIKLAPEVFESVPWYDYRRWVPGYSLGLFQELGLVDNSMSEEELSERNKLKSGIRAPSEFPDDASWSAYIRS
ncbi:MAG: DUF4105 domain-containing protein [Pseudomonadota bacterium]